MQEIEPIKISVEWKKEELDFQRKLRTLKAFEDALRMADRHFYLRLVNNETVEVIDLASGSKRDVNIACDTSAGMMYDIFRHAGDWIL